MDCTILRDTINASGAWGVLIDSQGTERWQTMERTWQMDGGKWVSKIPDGIYSAILGTHRLSVGGEFSAYEILVPGHSGILIHPANWTYQLDGCVALGMDRGILDNSPALVRSKPAFDAFMGMQGHATGFRIEFRTVALA